MMGVALVRPISAVAWELRAAWARGWRISLSLDERCDMPRLEGHVQRVSPTNGSVHVAGWHVPLDAVLAVHRPSRLGDSDHDPKKPWRGRAYRPPQFEELPFVSEAS